MNLQDIVQISAFGPIKHGLVAEIHLRRRKPAGKAWQVRGLCMFRVRPGVGWGRLYFPRPPLRAYPKRVSYCPRVLS